MANFIAHAAAASVAAIALVACDVNQTKEGSVTAPKFEVSKTQEGNVTLPKYDVTPPQVDVGTAEKTIKVPDVDVSTEKKTVEVPTVQVTPAPDK